MTGAITGNETSPMPVGRHAQAPAQAGQRDVERVRGVHGGAALGHATRRWLVLLVSCLALWALMRIVFFVGVVGSDDMYYMRYAALWDRAPANHWEARLLGNALTASAMKAFGRTEVAAVLPSFAASLAVLGCVLYWCRKYGTYRQAWWAGILLAVLPIDVEMASTISPHTIMAAMLGVGTLAFLHEPSNAVTRIVAAVLLSLGVITHFAGIYYVAALVLAALCVDRRRYIRTVALTFVVGIALVLVDMAVFHFAFGDALGRFRICLWDVHANKPAVPIHNGELNIDFFVWPVVNLVFSKAFGVSLLVVLVMGIWRYRRVDTRLRVLIVLIAVFWVWMSFGSQVPWAYRPFFRMDRFLQPLAVAVAVVFATVFIEERRRRLATVMGGGIIALCVFNLLAGGPWGQNVTISRELLAYARNHPEKRFVTDYHTHNEMYIIGGVKTLPNVAVVHEGSASQLLDRDAVRVCGSEVDAYDEILANPLNVARTCAFAAFLRESAGQQRYATKPAYRRICLLVPPLRDYPWALRKPPAVVYACIPPDSKRMALVCEGLPQ